MSGAGELHQECGREKVVGGDGLRGYEGASYGVADVILGAQGDFVGWFRGFQLLFESFRLPFGDGSRVSCLQRTALLLPPCRFDLPFFGISPRTQGAVLRRIELKCDLSTSVQKSTAKRSSYVISQNREIIDLSIPCISILNIDP